MKKIFYISLVSIFSCLSIQAAISGEGLVTNQFLWTASTGRTSIRSGATVTNIISKESLIVTGSTGNASIYIQAPTTTGSGLIDFFLGGTNWWEIKNPNNNPGVLEFKDMKNLTTPLTLINGQILAADGTAGAPSISFASAPTVGLYLLGGQIVFRQNGNRAYFDNSGRTWLVDTVLGLGDGGVFLVKDASDTLALRNGSNAQTFNLYNTYSDVSNGEWGFNRWAGNEYCVGTTNNGSGALRGLSFWPSSGAVTVRSNILTYGTVKIGTGSSAGFAQISPGDGTHTGYYEWFNQGGARVGYMGYDTGGKITLNLSSADFVVSGGGTKIGASGSSITNIVTATGTLDFGSINTLTSADLTITVSGAKANDSVAMGLPAAPTAGIVFNAFVSAADTVTVRAHNYTAGSIDPASATYRVTVTQF